MKAEWPLIKKTWCAWTYRRFLLNYYLSSVLVLWFAITLSKSSPIISCISSMIPVWKIAHCYFWFQETNCISKYTASVIQSGCGFINPGSFLGILSQRWRQLVESLRGVGIHSFDFMNCSRGSCLNVKRRNKNVVLSMPAQGDGSVNLLLVGMKNLSLSHVPRNIFVFWQHAGAWMKELPKQSAMETG